MDGVIVQMLWDPGVDGIPRAEQWQQGEGKGLGDINQNMISNPPKGEPSETV